MCNRVSLGRRPVTIDCRHWQPNWSAACRVIVTHGGDVAVACCKAATTPFRSSFVAGRRPGQLGTCRQPCPTGRQYHRRNLFDAEHAAKRLELLGVGPGRRPLWPLLLNPKAVPNYDRSANRIELRDGARRSDCRSYAQMPAPSARSKRLSQRCRTQAGWPSVRRRPRRSSAPSERKSSRWRCATRVPAILRISREFDGGRAYESMAPASPISIVKRRLCRRDPQG